MNGFLRILKLNKIQIDGKDIEEFLTDLEAGSTTIHDLYYGAKGNFS